jgi:hypothetical protein
MEIKPSSLNSYQFSELEYEIDHYPDIVPLALKRLRLKNIAEVDGDNFFRFWHIFQQEKWAKYEKEANGTDNK